MIYRVPYESIPNSVGLDAYAVFLDVGLSSVEPHAVRARPLKAVIDSGASRCLFHADLASVLGVRLEAGIASRIRGIGTVEQAWLHKVKLHLPGGPVTVLAGFKRNLPFAGLLGMNGFFEHFVVTFDGALKECSLTRIHRV